MVRANVDAVEVRPAVFHGRAQVRVDLVDEGLGEVAPRDAGLVGDHDGQPAAALMARTASTAYGSSRSARGG